MSDWPSNKPAYVSSLPGSPYDGQEIHYIADATNGVIWHLRYNASSASTYKWEFVGGQALYANVETAEATTSTSYAALTTAGPTVTPPLAGDYRIEFGVESWGTSTAGSVLTSFAIGATAAGDADASTRDVVAADAGQAFGCSMRRLSKTLASASTALAMRYRVLAGTGTFRKRWISAVPIRVG